MRHHEHLFLAAGVVLIGVAALAGCGDTTPADAPSTKATECAAQPGQTVTVEIPEFKFSPTPVKVTACDSVVWKNTADQAHTSTGNGDQSWSSGNIAPGSTSDAVLFAKAGSFTYICALHPFMKGTVEVS